jgi:hypothetical protein
MPGTNSIPLSETIRKEPFFGRRCTRGVRSRLVAVVVALLFVASSSAAAKMPGFSMTTDTRGRLISITVLVDGPDSSGFDAPHLNGLLAMYPNGAIGRNGRPMSQIEAIPIDLERVDSGVYRGIVNAPHEGIWAIVPFPTITDHPRRELLDTYPPTAFVTIDANRRQPRALPIAGLLIGSIVWRLGSSNGPRRTADRSSREALGTGGSS